MLLMILITATPLFTNIIICFFHSGLFNVNVKFSRNCYISYTYIIRKKKFFLNIFVLLHFNENILAGHSTSLLALKINTMNFR